MTGAGREIIVVRSLADSDLGLFGAHRSAATSKQRAININAGVARQLLAPQVFDAGGAIFECLVTFGNVSIHQPRTFGKSGKNWRLGGKKIEGQAFASLDSKDFMLIRTVSNNDGSAPLSITFIARRTNRVTHAGLAAIVERKLDQSMVVFEAGTEGFDALKNYCQPAAHTPLNPVRQKPPVTTRIPPPKIAPMPHETTPVAQSRKPTIHEKLRSPHIMERMFRVAGDLSAPAQLRFIEIVEKLASQLRAVLLETGGIIRIPHGHREFWTGVRGQPIGFIDGGLANLSSLGSAPIAARVGGYLVTPGEIGPEREQFTMLKHLIDELYAHADGGVYDDSFPDIGALRDAARISIEAAGAVQLLREHPGAKWILVHGALVNPVSRYTDIMQDGRVRHRFPDFSDTALAELLPSEPPRSGRDRNFISVYLRQIQLLHDSASIVCGVVEREATTTSVIRAVLDSLENDAIARFLPVPPAEWKSWFRHQVDPADDPDSEGQRVTDALLFRACWKRARRSSPSRWTATSYAGHRRLGAMTILPITRRPMSPMSTFRSGARPSGLRCSKKT